MNFCLNLAIFWSPYLRGYHDSYYSLASPKTTAILSPEVEFSKETPGAFGIVWLGRLKILLRVRERSFNRPLALGKIGGWSLEFDSLTVVFSSSGIRLCHERISYDKSRRKTGKVGIILESLLTGHDLKIISYGLKQDVSTAPHSWSWSYY